MSPWRRALVRAVVMMTVTVVSAAGDDNTTAEKVPSDGEVRVERIISSERDLGRRRLARWLTGQKDRDLFRRPYGVAWDGDALVVTDPGGRRVVRIEDKRRVRTSPPQLFESPIGVAACDRGIVVTDSAAGTVALLTRKLRLERWLARELIRPTGVACADGLVFVVETGRHRVLVLDPTADGLATVVRTIGARGGGDGEFNFPTTIAVGPDSLWAGDTLNFRLQRFVPGTGAFRHSFGQLGDSSGEMPRVKGIAIDHAGRLWVTDAFLDQVALYSQDGGFLTSLGGRGSLPGEFSFPAGISIHGDGRVAVADSLNRRLQIFQLTTDPRAKEAR